MDRSDSIRQNADSAHCVTEASSSVIADNILTRGQARRCRRHRPARFGRAIDQICEDLEAHKKPQPEDIFDDSFLPPVGGRLLN